jgi:hypothetical protein
LICDNAYVDLALRPIQAEAQAAQPQVSRRSPGDENVVMRVEQEEISGFAAVSNTQDTSPKRYQFVTSVDSPRRTRPVEPRTSMLDDDMEDIDEEFSTPSRTRGGDRTGEEDPASVPVRRNPRRSVRKKY